MRTLYNPLDLLMAPLKALGGLIGGGAGSSGPIGPSAEEQRTAEKAAADEASRKAKLELAQRQGARATVLTDAGLATSFGETNTGRKTLLGG